MSPPAIYECVACEMNEAVNACDNCAYALCSTCTRTNSKGWSVCLICFEKEQNRQNKQTNGSS